MADRNIYLTVQYVMKPKNPKQTSQKGFGKNADNYMYDEQIALSRGLKKKDLQLQQVILDLTGETVVKNTYNKDLAFAELFKYYHDGYSEYIDRSVKKLNGEQITYVSALDELEVA